MSHKRERQYRAEQAIKTSSSARQLAPGAVTLVERQNGLVQRKAATIDEMSASAGASQRAPLDGIQYVPGETADAFRDIVEGTTSVQLSRATTPPTGAIEQHAAAGVSGPGGSVPHAALMEAAFGTSFADVSAHTGPEAAAACEAIGAHAYAMGSHVAFKTADPDPALVAHELTHVLQQRSGVQAKGAGESVALESEADDVASRVARGESVSDVTHKYSASSAASFQAVQRKPNENAGSAGAPANSTGGAPGQTASWPGGPSGDKVERINFIDTDSIISLVKSQCRNMDIEKNGLTGHLLNLFSGDYFYGAAAWTSGWIDDGWNDTWSVGLTDVDMKVDIQLSIANPRERQSQQVESTGTSSGSGTATNTNSSATAVGGNAEISGGIGGNGRPSAGVKVGGNTSQTDTTTTTTGNTGSRSDTASYSNKRMMADVLMTVTVKYNATIPGLDFSTNRNTFPIGQVIYLRKEI